MRLITRVYGSIVQYFRTMSLFQPATTLPTASQTQLSPNVLQEVNQAVRALQRKENGASRRPLSHQKIALASGSTLAKMATQQSSRSSSRTHTRLRGVACPRALKRIYLIRNVVRNAPFAIIKSRI